MEQQASRVLRGIENQVDSPPTSPDNYSDSDDEMARTRRERAAKKRAQEAISGGGDAQPVARTGRRGGQGRAQEPQDAENGGAPRINRMNLTMHQLLAQLNQDPRIAAAIADAGAHNHPALGPLAGLLAPAAAPAAAQEPESDDEDAEARDQILLASLAVCKKNEAKKEMLMLIKDGIKHGLWRRIKIIESEEVRREAALIVLEILNFNSMQGDSIQAVQAQKDWFSIYEKHLCRLLNELRGYVQQRLKTLLEKWWRDHGKVMPRKDLLLALIKRDFALQEGDAPALAPDDYDALKWWITEVLPIAAGNQCDWQKEHYGYMTVQQGHYPNQPTKLYVTDSTEAIAVWIIENNYNWWPAQWEAKDEFGDHPIIRKAKNEDGEEVSMANSSVS